MLHGLRPRHQPRIRLHRRQTRESSRDSELGRKAQLHRQPSMRQESARRHNWLRRRRPLVLSLENLVWFTAKSRQCKYLCSRLHHACEAHTSMQCAVLHGGPRSDESHRLDPLWLRSLTCIYLHHPAIAVTLHVDAQRSTIHCAISPSLAPGALLSFAVQHATE